MFESSPTFDHWLVNPAIAGGVTGMICWSITLLECVTVSPYLLKNSTSIPASFSVETSGLSNLLPIWSRESDNPLAPIEYVSYCAAKLGRLPACPTE